MNMQSNLFIQAILLVAGFYLLVKGADWFVDGASEIAERFGIPHLVVGLTIVAMGTSLPETAVSLAAALKGSADITIGNVVGSNLLNVLVILGVTSVLVTLKVARTTIRYEIPFMILITFLLLAMGKTGNQINFWEGIILWIFFLAYLFYLFQMAKKNQQTEETAREFKPVWRLLLSIVVGVALIVLGSDVSVDAASEIARSIGFSERLIGLTIVALGTSLPELVTSVSAARKGKADIAIGNVVGSNVFNILFVVGTTALVTPVAFAANFVLDTILAAGAGILLWFLVWKNQHLTRKGGILLLAAYCIYMVYLLA
jgi:cation:H+ antiporter